jgi:hypothetical protein
VYRFERINLINVRCVLFCHHSGKKQQPGARGAGGGSAAPLAGLIAKAEKATGRDLDGDGKIGGGNRAGTAGQRGVADRDYGLGQQGPMDNGETTALSQLTGKKKSLFIGINYTGTSGELRGCINDVVNIKAFVTQNFGFPTDAQHMRTLTDDNASAMPTKQNILEAMQWLVQGAQAGDSLFFHYSGHGGSQKDVSPEKDEADGKDETLIPCDYQTKGVIVDDMIHEILVAGLPDGVRLTAVTDCCHSGTVFDLPFTYKTAGEGGTIQEVDNRKLAMQAAMSAVGIATVRVALLCLVADCVNTINSRSCFYTHLSFLQGKQFFIMKNKKKAMAEMQKAIGLFMSGTGKGDNAKSGGDPTDNQVKIRCTLGDVIQFSGCRDEQTSADASIGGQSQGAMSWALIKAYQPNHSYIELLEALRQNLAGKYKQVPQMSTGHKMDLHTRFGM